VGETFIILWQLLYRMTYKAKVEALCFRLCPQLLTYTGNIRWIQVVNDAVLATVASASGNVSGASRLQSITLPAGLGIGGNFSQVVLTSGVVIVYFA
jgi:hypothetical protein